MSVTSVRPGTNIESLTDSLTDRVERLLHHSERPTEWGHPRMSMTPTSVAIGQLLLRTEALENALREIALEVQKLTDEE
jgi:hypothetical protein